MITWVKIRITKENETKIIQMAFEYSLLGGVDGLELLKRTVSRKGILQKMQTWRIFHDECAKNKLSQIILLPKDGNGVLLDSSKMNDQIVLDHRLDRIDGEKKFDWKGVNGASPEQVQLRA